MTVAKSVGLLSRPRGSLQNKVIFGAIDDADMKLRALNLAVCFC
jgi:hypothetical protein